jgi:branched-chain amino acid transport system ATP-binding protein
MQTSASDPIISVCGVSVAFGGVRAVENVSLDVRPGEIIGLIGPNGAGKTTLLNLISGHEMADEGTIRVAGQDVTSWPLHRRAQLGLSRSYQSANVFPALTARENVALAAQAAGDGHLRVLRRAPDRALTAEKAQRALEVTGLSSKADSLASSLGHGQTRALEVAMLMATAANVMLMDEPAAGMAARDVEDMIDTVRAVHEEINAAILIVEHKIPLIFDLCNRIAVLDRGRLLAFDEPQRVADDPAVRAAYLGEEPTHA